VPRLSDPEQLIELAAIGSKFVRRMEISELMPPVVRSVETADTEDILKGKYDKKAELPQRRPRDAPYVWVPENFRESLSMPTATFPEIFNGLLFRSIL